MEVENIEELMSTVEGNPYWVVSFKGKRLTLTEWDKPTYSIGDELPYRVEVIKPEKERWYYKKFRTL